MAFYYGISQFSSEETPQRSFDLYSIVLLHPLLSCYSSLQTREPRTVCEGLENSAAATLLTNLHLNGSRLMSQGRLS